ELEEEDLSNLEEDLNHLEEFGKYLDGWAKMLEEEIFNDFDMQSDNYKSSIAINDFIHLVIYPYTKWDLGTLFKELEVLFKE
ncbi:14758_t:CDS:1, partial [Funneliformis geosporum]